MISGDSGNNYLAGCCIKKMELLAGNTQPLIPRKQIRRIGICDKRHIAVFVDHRWCFKMVGLNGTFGTARSTISQAAKRKTHESQHSRISIVKWII